MESMIMAFSFAAAITIAAAVVRLFSRPIDEALVRVIPAGMEPAWNRFAKFALFVVTFAGGMRLAEFAALLTMRTPAGPPIAAGQALLEIFKSITGSLVAAAVALLAFFVATLAVDASMNVYRSHRPAERPLVETERRPVGAERHARAKDRERQDSGRFS